MAIEDDHAPQEQEPWRAGEARFYRTSSENKAL